MSKAEGARVPYWRYDAICVSGDLATEFAERFTVEFREIVWRGKNVPCDASQIVASASPRSWFDEFHCE